jgi:apolipoprotein N-acyltransferase
VFLLLNAWGYGEGSGDEPRTFNSAMLIGPSGERLSRYDKIALMPFGEYVPARRWIPFMDRIPALVADLSPGTECVVSAVAGAKIGTTICFETTRPDLTRRFRLAGASTLVQLSNEAWFGPSALPRQMLAQAVFRAVENDVELIRASNSGSSARIDHTGVVFDETSPFEVATRVWQFESVDEVARRGETVYTRFGDVFAWVALAASLIIVGLGVVSREKES